MELSAGAIGAPLNRVDGPRKVTGAATYAYEHRAEGVAYLWAVQSTIAAGRVASIDASAPRARLALPGVRTVLSHQNAPRLEPAASGPPQMFDVEVEVLQSEVVA